MDKKTILLVVVLLGVVGAIYVLELGKSSPSSEIIRSNSEDAVSGTPINTQSESGDIYTSPQSLDATSYPNPKRSSLKEWELTLTDDDTKRIAQKSSLFPIAPELTGISGYINAEPNLQVSDFRGKVVLIDFWTYTCINCIRTLPHLVEWDEKYRDQGLAIIGVHTPEFEFEKNYDNVQMAMEKYGIDYRVVQDNDFETWREYKNRYWPRKYLIDGDGFIRYDHIGEGGYKETEEMIQALLQEQGISVNDMPSSKLEDQTPTTRNTPELYAGYDFALPRGQNVGNSEGMQPNKQIDYILPLALKKDTIYLEGGWKSNPDDLESTKDGASIVLQFTAKDANIVAHSNEPQNMEVYLNNELISNGDAGIDVENSKISIDEARLYNAVSAEYGTYTLKLTVKKGFSFSAFTFG